MFVASGTIQYRERLNSWLLTLKSLALRENKKKCGLWTIAVREYDDEVPGYHPSHPRFPFPAPHMNKDFRESGIRRVYASIRK